MSTHSSSGTSNIYGNEELLQIQTRCRELRKEKDMLRESQSLSFDLIRRLEAHVKTLSEARADDKKRIQELERELSNCSQEIDYLQDQLNARESEIDHVSERACGLELKFSDRENTEEIVGSLRQEVKESITERLVLIKELENKEKELQYSTLCIEKLEESISSIALEYQCEIESMKLDLTDLEQSWFEGNKLQEEAARENARMHELIQNYELRIQNAQKVIECLDEENKDLREKLETSATNFRLFLQKMEEHFSEWLENKDAWSPLSELDSVTSDIVGAFFARLLAVREADADSKVKMEKLSCQIHDYELLVSQLKEQLRDEKLKAKEEAEDLAQEMAELRYQITGLLEEECKRRACVEQLSLQRITELEAQIEKERRKSFIAARGIPEA